MRQGRTGATGPSPTANTALIANTAGGMSTVLAAGVNVSFNEGILPAGINIDGSNEVLTVADGGVYRISYNVNTTVAETLGVQVPVNNIPVAASQLLPGLPTSSYRNDFIVELDDNSTISLALYSLDGVVTLITGAGANMTVMQLS